MCIHNLGTSAGRKYLTYGSGNSKYLEVGEIGAKFCAAAPMGLMGLYGPLMRF